jgi:hypothetical protein
VSDLSFGLWRVSDTTGTIRKKSLVEVRLSDAGVTLIQQQGPTTGPWPVNVVRFEVLGPTRAYLRLGESIWIESVEQRSAADLLSAINERKTALPPPDTTSEGPASTGSSGCSGIVAVVGVLIVVAGLLITRELQAEVASGNDMAGLGFPLAWLVIGVGALLALGGALSALVERF